ncbi:hypothetical protein [uncultured Bartonella sp.]|uniref:hypothetical protein n=1 Tax=uncultured Bartonella sp. TaxID=104108 RepID=UPI0025FB65C1|nr:hypothetical protein [uncultured Bartonella sp.]
MAAVDWKTQNFVKGAERISDETKINSCAPTKNKSKGSKEPFFVFHIWFLASKNFVKAVSLIGMLVSFMKFPQL